MALLLASMILGAVADPILLSDVDRAVRFGGVGAISGGGATSRLLFDYPEPARSTILDLLWKPQYGASLQHVKVEIPADADTTCGSEVAHRHDAADGGSCTRGYEGWFLSEATSRSPGMTSSSLQWAAPLFVGEADIDGGDSLFTQTNIDGYVVTWLRCMRDAYGVNLTYQGAGWNEKPHNNTYIKLMRARLDAQGLPQIGLAAADQCCGSNWNIAYDMASDPALAAVVDVITTHVAGSLEENTPTPAAAIGLGKPLWQGEEHIGMPDPDPVPVWDWAAAASIGIEVSQNWVVNNMSATIYWPAEYGWLSGLLYRGKGLIVSTSPWGAAPFFVPTAAWVIAHTTHFARPGDWLLNGTGSGHIGDGKVHPIPAAPGGWNVSYVTYVSQACAPAPAACDFTLVVESFFAGGVWGGAGPAAAPAAGPASATFQLGGNLSQWAGKTLFAWHTNASVTFEREASVSVAADGSFSLSIEPSAVWTLTTVASAHPGARALLAAEVAAAGGAELRPGDAPPADAPFPLPYADSFDSYANDTLPLFTSDMFGAFTVYAPGPAAAASAAAAPAARPASDAVLAAEPCAVPDAAAKWPQRCAAPRHSGAAGSSGGVLRQWTRQPPIGWGHGSSNMATILGNSTLAHTNVSVDVLIETPDSGFAPPATPYVLVGLHGGNGQLGGSSPGSFYRQGPDFDFAWFNVEGQWGCSIAGSGSSCNTSFPAPGGFGYDTWHSVSVADFPRADGGAFFVVSFDGRVLLNVSQAPGTLKDGGAGGYVGLVTGCHRAQFDNLLIQPLLL